MILVEGGNYEKVPKLAEDLSCFLCPQKLSLQNFLIYYLNFYLSQPDFLIK